MHSAVNREVAGSIPATSANFKMRDFLESVIGYVIMSFIYFVGSIFGFEHIKKLGYCILKNYQDKPCDECKKINIYREGQS